MRQVPTYLIIGNGRVARHFQHYFALLQIPFHTWHRQESLATLYELSAQATHILLLISDGAIDAFAQEHLKDNQSILIHFSGSLVSEHVYGAHPLMSFNTGMYALAQYQAIPFILDHDAPDFASLLPGVMNQHVRLHTSLKAKYHALCVLSGNFSCLLWQKLFSSMENEFNIPHEIANAYLLQQTQNLLHDAKSALTGPLVRNDLATIEKNIASLEQDPFQEIYQSFVSCYQKIKEETLV